ncbi:hypothetical protein MXB_597, partial [Myxobolus squamalis]
MFSVSKGLDNSTTLISTYENRNNQNFLQILGETIIEIIRDIPAGVLVFFPSYQSLNLTMENWKKNSIWKRMDELKRIFAETKSCEDFRKKSNSFLNNNSKNNMFLAVCKGKMSEGMDFSDDSARAVIITGLPFPSKLDPRINLKLQVLNEN